MTPWTTTQENGNFLLTFFQNSHCNIFFCRFYKGGGVTQPSQRRYVAYFGELLKNWKKTPILKNLLSVNLMGLPRFSGNKGCRPYIEIYNVRENRLVLFSIKNANYLKKKKNRYTAIGPSIMNRKNMKMVEIL